MRTPGRWRLAVMMGLVYGVQGAYWPLLAIHLADLGVDSRARGWIFATLAIGSALVPLGAGQLADRLMPTQWFLTLIYALGTGPLVILASGMVTQAIWIFILFLAYWTLIGPSYSLAASLAMRNLSDPRAEFGWVRLWGTAGWMISGWLVSVIMTWSGSTQAGRAAFEAIWVATALSLAMAIYGLTLPHTPPLAVGSRGKMAWRHSINLARQRDVTILLVTSFGVYLTVPLVFQVMPSYLEARGLPRGWILPTMTLGQLAEIAVLALLPWLLARCGAKWTMALGIAAWFVRFFSLAIHPPLWLAVSGTFLHGAGIACVTVGGQVYLDSRCEVHLRASAQALLVVCTAGLGALVGSVLAGEIVAMSSDDDVLVFLIPCVIDGALLLYFLRGFRAPVWSGALACAPNTDSSSPPEPVPGSVVRSGHLVTESSDG
jgi:MFS family permease